MLPDSFANIDRHSPQIVPDPSNHQRQIDSVSDFFDFIQNFAKGQVSWWLRGESRVYPQPCLPTFSRIYHTYSEDAPARDLEELTLAEPLQQDAGGTPKLTTCLTQQELDLIRAFQEDPPADEYFERMVGNDANDPGWLIFAQHYGVPTRLLDVTSDPLVALYFACTQHQNETGIVWLYPQPMNAHGPHQPESLYRVFDPAIEDKQALAFHAEGRLHEYVDHIGRNGLIDAQFLYSFEAPNRRVLAQRGKFIWAGNPLWHLSRGVFGFSIPADSKAMIMNQIGPYGLTSEGLCLV